MPNTNQTFFAPAKPSTPIEFAKSALKKTRERMCLGSPNITEINYNLATDGPLIVSDLLAGQRPARSLQLDALLDQKIEELREGQLTRHLKLAIEEELAENYTSIQSKFSYWKHSINAQSGDCVALSRCALIELIQIGYTGPVEIMSFKKLNHVFLVLNRPEVSNPKDWKTWGKETIILDAWLNKIFSSDEFKKVWKEYINLPGVKVNLAKSIEAQVSIVQDRIKPHRTFSFSQDAIPTIKSEMKNYIDGLTEEAVLEVCRLGTDKEFREALSSSSQKRDHSYLFRK